MEAEGYGAVGEIGGEEMNVVIKGWAAIDAAEVVVEAEGGEAP